MIFYDVMICKHLHVICIDNKNRNINKISRVLFLLLVFCSQKCIDLFCVAQFSCALLVTRWLLQVIKHATCCQSFFTGGVHCSSDNFKQNI